MPIWLGSSRLLMPMGLGWTGATTKARPPFPYLDPLVPDIVVSVHCHVGPTLESVAGSFFFFFTQRCVSCALGFAAVDPPTPSLHRFPRTLRKIEPHGAHMRRQIHGRAIQVNIIWAIT